MSIRSRIAPTPSGFLHLGNAVNFILSWLLVRRHGGALKLRIDDADCARTLPEYVEDIFVQLEWLGLDWDEGPAGPEDFFRSHSQLLRLERYRQFLKELSQCSELFHCGCSRKQIRAHNPSGLYPGTCRDAQHSKCREHAIRVHVPPGTTICFGGKMVCLDREFGDFILWRRDDLPSYQLASLADDLDDRINLIVRGGDLLGSTAAQLFLAGRLRASAFSAVEFRHHALLVCDQGKKLSKSDNALSLAAMRRNGASPRDVYKAVAVMIGVNPEKVQVLADLLSLGDEAVLGSWL